MEIKGMVRTPLTLWNTLPPWPGLKMTYLLSCSTVSSVRSSFVNLVLVFFGIFTLHHFVGLMWDMFIIMWDYPTSFRFHFGLYI